MFALIKPQNQQKEGIGERMNNFHVIRQEHAFKIIFLLSQITWQRTPWLKCQKRKAALTYITASHTSGMIIAAAMQIGGSTS